jgi:hypothetical protein
MKQCGEGFRQWKQKSSLSNLQGPAGKKTNEFLSRSGGQKFIA